MFTQCNTTPLECERFGQGQYLFKTQTKNGPGRTEVRWDKYEPHMVCFAPFKIENTERKELFRVGAGSCAGGRKRIEIAPIGIAPWRINDS